MNHELFLNDGKKIITYLNLEEYAESYTKEEHNNLIVEIFNNKGVSGQKYDNKYSIFWKAIYFSLINKNYEVTENLCKYGSRKFNDIEFNILKCFMKENNIINSFQDEKHLIKKTKFCFDIKCIDKYLEDNVYNINDLETLLLNLNSRENSLKEIINLFNENELKKLGKVKTKVIYLIGRILLKNGEIERFDKLIEDNKYCEITEILYFDKLRSEISDELIEYSKKKIQEGSINMVAKLINFYYSSKNYDNVIKIYKENKINLNEKYNKIYDKTIFSKILNSMYIKNKSNEIENLYEEYKDKNILLCFHYVEYLINTDLRGVNLSFVERIRNNFLNVHKNNCVDKILGYLEYKLNNSFEGLKKSVYWGSISSMKEIINKILPQNNTLYMKSLREMCIIVGYKLMDPIISYGYFIELIEKKIKEKERDYNSSFVDKILNSLDAFKYSEDKLIKINLLEYLKIYDKNYLIEKIIKETIYEKNLKIIGITYVKYLEKNETKEKILEELKKLLIFYEIFDLKEKNLEILLVLTSSFLKNSAPKNFKTQDEFSFYIKNYIVSEILNHYDKFPVNINNDGTAYKDIKEARIIFSELDDNIVLNCLNDVFNDYKNIMELSMEFNFLSTKVPSIKIIKSYSDAITKIILKKKKNLIAMKKYLIDNFGEDNSLVKFIVDAIDKNKKVEYCKNHTQMLKKEVKCPICFDEYNKVVILPCSYNHFQCENCYFEYEGFNICHYKCHNNDLETINFPNIDFNSNYTLTNNSGSIFINPVVRSSINLNNINNTDENLVRGPIRFNNSLRNTLIFGNPDERTALINLIDLNDTNNTRNNQRNDGENNENSN